MKHAVRSSEHSDVLESDVVAQVHIEDVAQKLFDHADSTDRQGSYAK